MANYKNYFTLIGQFNSRDQLHDRNKEKPFQYMSMFQSERNLKIDDLTNHESDMHAILIDSNDKEFLRIPLSYAEYCSDSQILPQLAVRGYIPFDEKTSVIRFTFKGKIMDELKVPNQHPKVKIFKDFEKPSGKNQVQLKWDVAYKGTNKIQSKVLYSNDDGKSWISVGERTEDNMMVIKTSVLPGGKNCCFAVKVTDGFHNIIAETDRFSVPDLPPQVEILDPLDGELYEYERSLLLNGQAYNRNNDSEIVDNLLWESSIDGKLEEGQLVQVRLSKGEHKITLNAQQGKLSSSKSVSIIVK